LLKKDASNARTSEQQQQSLQLVDELKRSKAIVDQEVEVKARRITSLEKDIEQLTEQVAYQLASSEKGSQHQLEAHQTMAADLTKAKLEIARLTTQLDSASVDLDGSQAQVSMMQQKAKARDKEHKKLLQGVRQQLEDAEERCTKAENKAETEAMKHRQSSKSTGAMQQTLDGMQEACEKERTRADEKVNECRLLQQQLQRMEQLEVDVTLGQEQCSRLVVQCIYNLSDTPLSTHTDLSVTADCYCYCGCRGC
jgi:chromosome segregation ATPase